MFDFIKRSVVARVIDEDITGGYVVAIYSKYFRYHLDTIVVHCYEDEAEQDAIAIYLKKLKVR